MGIKDQVISEINLRRRIRGGGISLAMLSRESGVSYSGLRRWVNDGGRGMSDISIDKIVMVLGKRFILIDNK